MVVDKRYYFALALIKHNGNCFKANSDVGYQPGWELIPCDNCFMDTTYHCFHEKEKVSKAKEYISKITFSVMEQ